MSEVTTDPEQLVSGLRDATHEENYDEISNYVSESFVLYEPPIPEEGVAGPAGEAHGAEGLTQYMQLIHSAFSDLEVPVSHMLSDGSVVMCEGTMSYTWDGEWLGIQPTGAEVEVPVVEIAEVVDGRIQEWRTYFDRLDVQEQMGLDGA